MDSLGIEEMISDKAYDIGSINVENVGDSPYKDPEAQRWYSEVYSKAVVDYIEPWIATLQVTPKTVAMRRATLSKLAETFPMIKDINRKAVRQWINDLLASGLNPATVQRMASDWYRAEIRGPYGIFTEKSCPNRPEQGRTVGAIMLPPVRTPTPGPPKA